MEEILNQNNKEQFNTQEVDKTIPKKKREFVLNKN